MNFHHCHNDLLIIPVLNRLTNPMCISSTDKSDKTLRNVTNIKVNYFSILTQNPVMNYVPIPNKTFADGASLPSTEINLSLRNFFLWLQVME